MHLFKNLNSNQCKWRIFLCQINIKYSTGPNYIHKNKLIHTYIQQILIFSNYITFSIGCIQAESFATLVLFSDMNVNLVYHTQNSKIILTLLWGKFIREGGLNISTNTMIFPESICILANRPLVTSLCMFDKVYLLLFKVNDPIKVF